ncbi:hypothetical protein [uncultured Gammaproteobacteria bacterium]|nr:hypothetical protein [uncultured Gammaproteobacteria bacterium]
MLLIVFRLTSTTPKLFTEIINPNINNSIIFYPLFRSISLNIKIITTKPQLRGFMVKLIT